MGIFRKTCDKCKKLLKKHKKCGGIGCYSNEKCDMTLTKRSYCVFCDKPVYGITDIKNVY